MPRSFNTRLAPLPSDDDIIAAVGSMDSRYQLGASANQIAKRLDVEPANRAGRDAVKGSWTGRMSPSLRLSPRLRSLVKRGLLYSYYDTDTYRHYYYTKGAK